MCLHGEHAQTIEPAESAFASDGIKSLFSYIYVSRPWSGNCRRSCCTDSIYALRLFTWRTGRRRARPTPSPRRGGARQAHRDLCHIARCSPGRAGFCSGRPAGAIRNRQQQRHTAHHHRHTSHVDRHDQVGPVLSGPQQQQRAYGKITNEWNPNSTGCVKSPMR